MANLWITQYAAQSAGATIPTGEEPNLGTIKLAVTAASAPTATTLDPKTRYVRLYADAQMQISFGTAPDALLDPIAFPIAAGAHAPIGIAGTLIRATPGLKVAAATV